ncbi:DUF2795 domain-containing protein [Mycolicibacterium setense]|uniref:DUF2795 domain-containing protein n=1 Tax=Mycolicibacterium setense TaxID=431269 RepID=UPI000AFBB531|nr:DUF2795 domain-containing protein [Mycolicibacterium setense]
MVASVIQSRLRDCLYDVDFPADKDQIVNVAMKNACEDAARALRAMPPETYANMAEVLASVSLSDGNIDDGDKAAVRRTV